jgi:hypothetical protein
VKDTLTETPIKFSSSAETQRWLQDQTSTVLAPVHAQAKKLLDDTNTGIRNIEEVSKLLFDTSSKEIEKRNMKLYNRARALNKLSRLFLDRFKKLTPPEEVSFDALNRYTQDTQKTLLVTDIDLKNWFPRISPFFIMDRRRFLQIYERAKQAYNALNDYVNNEYINTKTLEEALQELKELQDVEKQLQTLEQEKTSITNERIPLENEIAGLEEQISDLQSKGPIDKLNLINAEIESLSNELKHTLRHLQKPFLKMQALATQGGGGGITPDELYKINQYMESPFDALVSEQLGFPVLKDILQKLKVMLDEDTLKLKSDKARKAEQTVNDVLQNKILDSLQIRCLEMANSKTHLLTSSKMDEIKQNVSQLQEQVDQLTARKTSVETHEAVKDNRYKETEDKINNLKRTIERKVYSSTGITVQIA